jgi:integrase
MTKRPNGIWYVVYRVDGKQKMKSLGTRRRSDAVTLMAIWEKERIQARLEGKDPDAAVRDPEVKKFWPKFFAWMQQSAGYRRSTLDGREWAWRRTQREFSPERLSDITQDRVEAHRRSFRGNAITWNDWHRAMRSIYKQAIEEGFYTGVNPFDAIKPLKEIRTEKPVLDTNQIRELMAAAVQRTQDKPEKLRDSSRIEAVFALGVFMGLRRGEIAAAKWEWLDWRTRRLVIPSDPKEFQPKNSKTRSVPLFSVVLPYLGEPKESGFIYRPDIPWRPGRTNRLSFKTSFNEVCEDAGLTWVSPHILRHTFITHALQAGRSVWEVGKWVGHSTAYMTEHYSHTLSPTEETLELFQEAHNPEVRNDDGCGTPGEDRKAGEGTPAPTGGDLEGE